MGKIFNSPEVVRVYTGSYWDEPLLHKDFEKMFDSDEGLLIHELVNLPKSCAERKVNEVVKRIRIIKVHVCILTYLKRRTPKFLGRKNAMKMLINNLDNVFESVQLEYKLSHGDFPDVESFAERLRHVDDFSCFRSVDKKTLKILDDLILKDIPAIMKGSGGVSGPGDKMVHEGEGDTSTILDHGSEKTGPLQNTLLPLLLFGSAMLLAFAYIGLFLLTMKDVGGVGSILPVALVDHFVQVGQCIRRYVFDTIPSGEALI
jgi:hypothetical protein